MTTARQTRSLTSNSRHRSLGGQLRGMNDVFGATSAHVRLAPDSDRRADMAWKSLSANSRQSTLATLAVGSYSAMWFFSAGSPLKSTGKRG